MYLTNTPFKEFEAQEELNEAEEAKENAAAKSVRYIHELHAATRVLTRHSYPCLTLTATST